MFCNKNPFAAIIKRAIIVLVFLNLATEKTFSQADSAVVVPQKLWKFGGKFLFHINESTFTNWASGGENQLSSKAILKPFLIFDNHKWSWETELDLRYGQQRKIGDKPKKNDDELVLISKLGKRLSEKWKFSGMYSFNSQFTPSWDGDRLQSTFMAPAYTNFSLGFDYTPNSRLSIYFTPLNNRNTWVLNDTLSARGEFAIEPGNTLRFRLGPSALISYKGEISKNILLDTKLGYFQDVLDGLGDPVINWDALFTLKVNRFISSSFSFTLFYDEDSMTEIKDADGNVIGNEARIQFKQSLGVGLNINW